MNKKQCPKCGEENPPEAVMCWACYTPLSGGGAAAGGASAASVGTAATHDDGEKKKIPPWQLGVIGFGLLIAIGIGARSMMPGPASGEGIDPPPVGVDDPALMAPIDGGGGVAPSPTPGNNGGGGGGSSIKPEAAPYKIVVNPNPQMATGTMAIVPTDANASGSQAASMAAAVRLQYGNQSKRWSRMYIYVFADDKAAETFANIMRQRRGAPLSGGDYAALSSLWSSTLARYEYSGGKEKVLYPSKNPSGWWYGN